ncbi:AIP3, partial [Symbiodinium sp. KB8]
EVEVEVRWEDQQKINRFGVLTDAKNELDDDIKAAKKELESNKNALDAIEEGEVNFFGEDGVTSVMLGEAFVACSTEAAQEHVEKLITASTAKVAALQAELDSIQEERGKLRTVLYARFGSSIGLDDAEE